MKNLFIFLFASFLLIDLSISQAQQQQQQQQQVPQQNPQPQQQQQQQQAGGQSPTKQSEKFISRGNLNKLYRSSECQDDIKEYCPRAKNIEMNDLSVLQCIYNEVPDLSVIDKECQHLLYLVKKNFTVSLKLDSAVIKVCDVDLQNFPDCKSGVTDKENGFLLSCLLGHRENITVDQCKIFLKNVAALVFSDYRLITNFQEDCHNDIEKFKCGRLEKDSDAPTQQGKTIECLSKSFENLEQDCRKQVIRVTELQSEDFHLDRVLYFACRDDREHFCERVQSGSGRVYKCLMKNKFSPEMSKACQEQLTRRQKIIVQNVDVDRSLIKACRKDILQNECRKELRGNSNSNDIQLASLMLCLERAIKDGTGVEPECRAELVEHRKMLMTDYQLNPNIVKYCKDEIKEYCNGGIERGGKTLHCLLNKAKLNKVKIGLVKKVTFTDACFAELANFVKIVDAGEDVRVDPNLYEACENLITGVCKDIQPGHGRMVACLTKQLGTNKDMNEECEERLLEIQFFVARDWALNPELYSSCKEDAVKLCNAPSKWHDWTTKAEGENVILPCLFHHIHDDEDSNEDKDQKVSEKCSIEVKNVMSRRAKSLDLMPEIQNKCSEDLSKYCSSTDRAVTQKGEELRCLQVHYKQLDKDCRNEINLLTKAQNKDIRLDQILLKACLPTIDEYCAEKREEKGELLECLIKQKNNPKMQPKCRAGIEHHQLLNIQDVSLNFKFKKLCSAEIVDHCPGKSSKVEVIQCLSEFVLNDTLLEKSQRISDTCRNQLRFELLQMNENIKLDPVLSDACKDDIDVYCSDVTSGKGRVIECLRTNQRKVSKECFKQLFKREKMNLIDQNADFSLQSQCKNAIQLYCHLDSDVDVISCLRKHLLKPSLEPYCRQVVINRIMMQNKDARLNPSLWKSCSRDVSAYCKKEFSLYQNEELNGRVLKCLKNAFVKNKLSKQCEVEVEEVMREAANVDFQLDPLLVEGCLNELETLCSTEPNDKKEQCLRLKFQNRKISQESKCYEEVRRIIVEGAADVFVDHELSQMCSSDLTRFCSDVAPGSSQHLKCLLDAKSNKKNKLSERCTDALNSRNELWRMAHVEDSLTGLNDLARLVNESEHRSYLLSVLTLLIFMVFVLGCVCRPALFGHNRRNKLK